MPSTSVFDWTTPSQGGVGWNEDLDDILELIDAKVAAVMAMDYTAGEDIDQYEVVYYKFTDGKLWLADGDDETKLGLLAIADETKTTGNAVRAITQGRITNTSWTWTAGSELFVDPSTPGALTAVRPASDSPVVAIALSSTEIYFNPLAWKRCTSFVRIGALSASGNYLAFCVDHTVKIGRVEILSNTATVGSDGTNNWAFVVQNLTDANTVCDENTNAGGDISADTPWSLGVVSNNTIQAGDVLEIQVTKNNSPTSPLADVAVLIHYDRFIG